MKKYLIEREIPGVDLLNNQQLSETAAKSNAALCAIGSADIQWVHSYVTQGKTFCIYLASGEEAIRRHAEVSGFPANNITEITTIIDPATALT